MGRILAIDYGRKRVGLAVTDELKIIATALGTVHAADVIAYLKRYLSNNSVECFVVGEPRDWSNRIERYDERFTSMIASRAIRDAGAKKSDRQNKALVDSVSATLILQSYLETLQRNE